MSKLIEGPLPSRADGAKPKVTIVDDTCSLGGSLLQAIAAAEEAGCEVVLTAVVLDRNQGGSDSLRQAGYRFHALLEADTQGQIRPAVQTATSL